MKVTSIRFCILALVLAATDSCGTSPAESESESQELDFDFGSNSGYLLMAEMNVEPDQVYEVTVFCEGAADGKGWPGSVAGSNLSITLPSITWEFALKPIVAGVKAI